MKTKPPDFYNMIMIERGAPEGWHWYSLKAVGANRQHGGAMIVGAVAPLLTRGKNKGLHNWRSMDKATVREDYISFADYDARVARWERETGLCSSCGGDGQSFASTGVNGTTYRDCGRCRATGKAAA